MTPTQSTVKAPELRDEDIARILADVESDVESEVIEEWRHELRVEREEIHTQLLAARSQRRDLQTVLDNLASYAFEVRVGNIWPLHPQLVLADVSESAAYTKGLIAKKDVEILQLAARLDALCELG